MIYMIYIIYIYIYIYIIYTYIIYTVPPFLYITFQGIVDTGGGLFDLQRYAGRK